MATREPNTICKNIYCTKGKDGGRKHYYTCRLCVHTMNWRAMACSEECYDEYMDQVSESRSVDIAPDYPERTDMSQEEVRALINDADRNDVIEETRKELEDEMAENPDLGIGEIIDLINRDE